MEILTLSDLLDGTIYHGDNGQPYAMYADGGVWEPDMWHGDTGEVIGWHRIDGGRIDTVAEKVVR